jgi:hypothetical protein
MNTLEDLKNYIKETHNVDPENYDGKTLKYHSIEFERGTKSVLLANKNTADMWTVRRVGHSIDFFRTEELETAVSKSGSLPYYFVSK